MKLKMTFLALLLGGSAMAQVSLKVATKRDTVKIEDATRITYSDDLSEQIIHTATGEEQKQALNNVWEVILGDTLHNIIEYLAEDAECNVFRSALLSGYNDGGRSGGFMGQFHHYSNFQTEGHQFAFFAPLDGYQFPRFISFETKTPLVALFKMKTKVTAANAVPIDCELYHYDISTGEVGKKTNMQSMTSQATVNELKQQLLQHTVFFERPEDKAAGIRSGNEYFKTLAGTYIRVNNDSMRVQGAYQMESEAAGRSSFTHSQIVETKQKQNGFFYKLDTPILAPAKNTYDVLSGSGNAENAYAEFFNLCQVSEEIITKAFQLDQYTGQQLQNILNGYCIFASRHNNSYSTKTCGLLPIYNQDFTLYVPTNEAVRQAIADGLPTWESIEAMCRENVDAEGNVPEGVIQQALLQVEELLNFIKYHFHFGSEVADKLPFAARTHNTPVVLRENLTTPKLTVSSKGNGTLSVTDACGNVRNVVATHKNVFVQEVWTNKSVPDSGATINATTPGVIHLIDGVLRYK